MDNLYDERAALRSTRSNPHQLRRQMISTTPSISSRPVRRT